nr:glycerate kinase [Paludibacterium yongneupense]
MKIVIAPDSFKESLSAAQVAAQIEAGFRCIFPDADYVALPMADGGEGTVDALVAAASGRRVHVTVTGPACAPLPSFFGLLGGGRLAVIEMAAASGLALLPAACRNPLHTTTRGTGELMLAALDQGCRHLLLGLGGSATSDGGAGMLQALGARLIDREGCSIPCGGAGLAKLADIDLTTLDPRLAECRIDVACDVDNPLLGPDGAAAVFGPQKGATPGMVAELEAGLGRFADIIAMRLGIDVRAIPGGGAAGGMGAALAGLLGATMRPGIEIVIEAAGLDAALDGADLLITGEGRIDGQTARGKTPMGVARVARQHGVPVIGIAGSLSPDVDAACGHGIDAVFSVLYRPCSLQEALRDAADNIYLAARNVAALYRLGHGSAISRAAPIPA